MKSPEMAGGVSETPQRPTEEILQAKVDDYNRLKEDVPHRYYQVVNELQDFSRGEGEQDVLNQYYKGWTKEDFHEVLKRLEE